MAMSGLRSVTVLLPALDAGLGEAPRLARMLGRADALEPGVLGREAQLLRHFRVVPTRIPVAPLTRLLDARDAGLGTWVRCDPAHVRPDLSTARMLACGTGLELDAAEAEALLAPLRPLFGDFGMPISAPHPQRWYAQLPAEAAVPALVPPEVALGRDLFDCLPPGPQGQRWRRLWNEAQVLLHHNEVNRSRARRGLPEVNSLWFWGAGRLPDSALAPFSGVLTLDPVLRGLLRLAELPERAAEEAWTPGTLVDLVHVPGAAAIEQGIVAEMAEVLRLGALDEIVLDSTDGRRWVLAPRQRWRFWKRPLHGGS